MKGIFCEQKLQKEVTFFESANGIHLDVDHGTYPYVTSSGCGPAFIPQSCGLPNLKLDRIIGITKAYTTRVGSGELPTELDGPIAQSIRKIGNEFRHDNW
jgi:adenylosuccinate synthase